MNLNPWCYFIWSSIINPITKSQYELNYSLAGFIMKKFLYSINKIIISINISIEYPEIPDQQESYHF